MYWKYLLAITACVILALANLTAADLLASREAASAEPLEGSLAVAPAANELATRSAILPSEAEIGSAVTADDDVETAVSRFGAVVAQSHPDALRHAFRAYYKYRSAHPDKVRKPYLYFVDFGFDNRTPRGYVFDMDALTIVEGPFTVAHGRGSAPGNAALPTRFLNASGSKATSLGLYLAQETYAFSGKSGGRSYRSIGLRLQGLSGRYNNAARSRGIVVHGAPYVTPGRAGRSEGCPAMELRLAQRLIPMIANGGLVFHFSPNDTNWLKNDPWAGA